MPEAMFLEKVKSEGLAHISYMVGHGAVAAVIDPRRDVEAYVEMAREKDCRIAHIFETHRNEDYLVGSRELAAVTGAEIHHGAGLEWGYGEEVAEGDDFELGGLRLTVLATPGHTDESISLMLSDTKYGEDAVGVFTGDALFVGDVGRTDSYPDRPREVAGKLYDSLFGKLLRLGDQVQLWPAHGAGSVCGSGMAAREFSTLGYERRHNPALQVRGRELFIERKVGEHHYQPPYFKEMEVHNQQGDAPFLADRRAVEPLSAGEFGRRMEAGALAIDLRSPEAFAGAFVPGSLNIPLGLVAAYAGWLAPYDRDLVLVVSSGEELEGAVRYLARMGYDRVVGYLRDGLHEWETAGRAFGRLGTMTAGELADGGMEGRTVLDVRKEDEWRAGHLPGAVHVFLGELEGRLGELDRASEIVTFCGSGRRASIAASVLLRGGFERVVNNLGSMKACRALGCPIVKEN